jgi:hypothetical protein
MDTMRELAQQEQRRTKQNIVVWHCHMVPARVALPQWLLHHLLYYQLLEPLRQCLLPPLLAQLILGTQNWFGVASWEWWTKFQPSPPISQSWHH